MNPKTTTLLALFLLLAVSFAAYILVKPGETSTTTTSTTSSTSTTTTTQPFAGAGCQLIARDCVDEACPYFDLCDEGDFTECWVYDCQIEYMVNITRADGRKIIKTSPKSKTTYSNTQLEEIKKRCSGKVEIIEQECVNNKLQLQVRVETDGVCGIQAFIADAGGGYQTLNFKKTNNTYNLTLNHCPQEYKITAITEGGITIK
ncbi:MAG: hypothetical protein JW778_08130 [Candidatus Altiarchaeota archaeon]|nr:hypothetical protein [Candidatus Altiarchaeota archaeon]